MSYDKIELCEVISKSFENYKIYGPRSTKKLEPIHDFFSKQLRRIWGYDYLVYSMDNKEYKVQGKYYPKDVDIAVYSRSKGRIVFCLGIKFITSNYKQNANNYFENMMGETANIQANDIPYSHVILFRRETPYYVRSNNSEPSKIETISERDLLKYSKLILDKPQAHRPRMLGLFLMEIDESTNRVSPTHLENYFSSSFCSMFDSNLSMERYFEELNSFKLLIDHDI